MLQERSILEELSGLGPDAMALAAETLAPRRHTSPRFRLSRISRGAGTGGAARAVG